MGQGRRCAWGILVFLEDNVALKQFAYKEGMSNIQSEERDLKYSGTTQVCPEKWGSVIYAWIYDHTESHVSRTHADILCKMRSIKMRSYTLVGVTLHL